MKNKTKLLSLSLLILIPLVLVACGSKDEGGLGSTEAVEQEVNKYTKEMGETLYESVISEIEEIEKTEADGDIVEIGFADSDKDSFLFDAVDPEERIFTNEETGKVYEHVFDVSGTYRYDHGNYDFVEYQMFISFGDDNMKGEGKVLAYQSNLDGETWDDYKTQYYDDSISNSERSAKE